MSHFTKVKTQIVEKEALKGALIDLGYEPLDGPVEVRGWSGQRTKADLKIAMKKSNYDLGFLKRDETYDMVADWYGIKDFKKKDFVNQLTQRYAYHVTKSKLEAQGFSLAEQEEKDGRIHLVLRRMA